MFSFFFYSEPVIREYAKHPLFSLEISGNAKCWGPSVFLFVCRKSMCIQANAGWAGPLLARFIHVCIYVYVMCM